MNAKIFVIVIVCVVVVSAGIYLVNQKDDGASLAPGTSSGPQVNPDSAVVPPPTQSPQAQTPPSPVPATPPSALKPQAPVPTPTAPVNHSVSIQNFAFNSSSITIKKGDAAVWTNIDSAPHTVTGDGGGPSSPTLNTNGTYRFTFNSTGTFRYHCAFHPSMIASVVVTD